MFRNDIFNRVKRSENKMAWKSPMYENDVDNTSRSILLQPVMKAYPWWNLLPEILLNVLLLVNCSR